MYEQTLPYRMFFFSLQYKVRQVGEPFIPKYTPQDIRLAAHEVASYFPALSSCEPDVIKFLSKKIRAFVKSQRKRIKRKNADNPKPGLIDNEHESGEIHDKSDDEDIDIDMTENISPRKRCLSESVEPDTGAQSSSKPKCPAKKVKKAIPDKPKKLIPDSAPGASDHVSSAPDPVGKEFCSNNPENVKFEEGHFVVLGKGVDAYEYCKVDKVVYHKQFQRYSMEVTYYEEIDGRLEVYPIPNKTEPWKGKKVPLNTIIMNLRKTRLVDSDIKKRIREITRQLYS